jgi:hypothetical protein
MQEKLGGRLPLSQFEPRYCDPVDPLEIYEIVKKAVLPRQPDERPRKAIIDITGGKKVMSAGAALAASQLDLQMCYIDSDFDPEMRQARPGLALSRRYQLRRDSELMPVSGRPRRPRTSWSRRARSRFACTPPCAVSCTYFPPGANSFGLSCPSLQGVGIKGKLH